MNTLRVVTTAIFGVALMTLILLLRSTVSAADTRSSSAADPLAQAPAPVLVEAVFEPSEPQPQWYHHAILKGDTLGDLLALYGLDAGVIRKAALSVHDLSRLRTGRELAFLLDPGQSVPSEIRYALGEDRTLVLRRSGESWSAEEEIVQYEKRVGLRALTVSSSLWDAAVSAGLRPADIAALAKVLECDIDFNTEIRPGATASMVIEELWRDGELAKLGAPLGLRFKNGGKEYVAIRFQDSSGKTRYYDKEGTSKKAAFLRSPLEFSRVTSGFNLKRFHPILKRSRPHLGTDFGAPSGTPVRAVGDGVVTIAGRHGGHGNYVKLKHNGPYESSYSHLSRIAVRDGQRIEQGQVIGYVGSTGMSTGPHLHYQFWVNGRIVDPMKIDLPRGDALTPADRDRFVGTRDQLLAMIDGQLPVAMPGEATEDPVADAAE